MSDEDLEKIVATTIDAWVEKTGHACRYDVEQSTHKKHHEVMDRLICILDRLEWVKWGVLKGFLQAMLIVSVLGLIAFLWKHGVQQ